MAENTPEPSDYETSPTLEEWTRGVIASLLEIPAEEVQQREDGAFHLSRGSAAIWVQPYTSDPPHLWIYSWMVTGLKPHPDLLTMINQINVHSAIGTVDYNDDGVRVSHALLAGLLDADDVRRINTIVADIADDYDHLIQERFGGRIAYYQARGDEIDV